MTKVSMQKVREDFDLIAPFETEKWNRNNHYHEFLLKQLPPDSQNILEIGCGIGTFSRNLAQRCKSVTALDLSPKMLETAKNLSKSQTNINFQLADILETQFPDESFETIVSIATFHHLPLEKVLPKLKKALKIGGKLIILDVLQVKSLVDFAWGSVALPVGLLVRFFHHGLSRPTKAEREAWEQHARTDRYLSFSEVQSLYPNFLTNPIINRHFFFRYSVIWQK